MAALIQSWIPTAVFCVGILALFGIGWARLGATRSLVEHRNRELIRRLATLRAPAAGEPAPRAREDLRTMEQVQREIEFIVGVPDAAKRQTEIHRLRMQAARLEGDVAFWVDLLRQVGLLGTVLGLGLSLTFRETTVDNLLQPLSLAVWTTFVGLLASVVLAARFRDVEAHADMCERYLDAVGRLGRADAGEEPGGAGHG